MALDVREFTEVKRSSEQSYLLQTQRQELSANIDTFHKLARKAREKSFQFNGLFSEMTLLMDSAEAMWKEFLVIQKTPHINSSSK